MNNNPLKQYFRRPAIYLKLPSEGKYYPVDAIDLPENKELDIWKSTQNALDLVVGLLNKWDEKVADKNFAMNVDMDKPREERVKEFKKVKTKLGKFKVKDIKSDSPATAKAELKGSKNSIFVEVQMSPEKDNKIQKITFMKK